MGDEPLWRTRRALVYKDTGPGWPKLKMIDGFFTAVFAEDTVTLRHWPEVHA